MAESYRINITQRALAYLESVFEYISREWPSRAADVIKRILDAIDDLEFMPGDSGGADAAENMAM